MHNALKFILNDDEGDCEESHVSNVKCKPKQSKEAGSPTLVSESQLSTNPTPSHKSLTRQQTSRPSISKEINRPKKAEPEKFSFKPTINPNSQKILERLNALKQHKETQHGKIEDSLLQRQRQQLVKSKSPVRPSEKQTSARKMTDANELSQSKPKAFASQVQIENFYSKRFLTRSWVSPS